MIGPVVYAYFVTVFSAHTVSFHMPTDQNTQHGPLHSGGDCGNVGEWHS